MAAPIGPKKVHRYTVEFKVQAVRLSLHPEIQTQDVAHALDIHPFMLSKWKKDYREGKLKLKPAAAALRLPKVLRTPKPDAEKQALSDTSVSSNSGQLAINFAANDAEFRSLLQSPLFRDMVHD